MKLWHFQQPVSGGCYQYRDQQPMDALRARGHEVKTSVDLDACHPDEWEGFLFSRVCWGEYPLFVAEIKECGKPIIYDVDDAWDQLAGWYPEWLDCQSQLPSYYYFLHEATLVTTTTDRLAAHLRGLGAKRVVVLPNCCHPTLGWQMPSEKVVPRVGFIGAVGHLDDVCVLLDAAVQAREQVAFELVVMGLGLQPGDTFDDFMYRSASDMPHRHRDWLPVIDRFANAMHRAIQSPLAATWLSTAPTAEYWATIRGLDLDIGCLPLTDTRFNRCKSFSKFYEYAALGSLTLASPLLGTGEPVVTVYPNTVDEWAARLVWWVQETNLRRTLAASQQAWVQGARDHRTWAAIRERSYRLVVHEAAVCA